MKGKLSISKVTCCGVPKEDYISIEVEDTLSSIRFIEVKMDLETFVQALFGLGNCPVEFELQGSDKVGKKYECSTEPVFVPHNHDGFISDDLIDKAVSSLEHDGWIGDRQDCNNHHNWVENLTEGAIYNVHFYRWVNVEEK